MDPSQSGTESGGERMMEDEFACAGALRDSLTSQRLSVEKVFRVSFGIGTDDVPTTDGQMWLNLRGASHNVAAAKLFVRGIVNEEQQQEVSYPGFLDCVFCGARGLFMDCLIKNTSAHIVVGSYGCLLISGLTEPVVQAYSLITDLLEKFQGNQGQCTETGSRALGKSLDSSRAFNCLVRKWEDKYTTDLLMLPEVVKQSLLSLVKESGLYSGPGFAGCPPESPDHRAGQGAHGRMSAGAAGLSWDPDARLWPEGSQDADGHGMEHSPAAPRPRAEPPSPAGDPPAKGLTGPQAEDLPTRGTLLPARPTAGGSEAGEGAGVERCLAYDPQEVEASVRLDVVKGTEEVEEEKATGDEEVLLSVGSRKEFRLLLKFFTAMGYTEQVVRQVLARTGPREASQILDLVQQEQDRSDKNPEHGGDHAGKGQLGRKNSKPLIDWLKNKSQTQMNCTESELGEGDLGEKGLNGRKSKGGLVEAQEPRGADSGRMGLLDPTERSSVRTLEDDFVLAVLKNAAASCGYTEEKVEEVYSTLPDLSTHQLILRLQQEAATLGVTSQEVEEVLDGEGRGLATGEEEIPGIPGGHRTARVAPKGKKPSATRDPLAKPSVATPIPRPEVRGPPLLTYPSGGLDPPAVPHQLPQAGRKAKKTAQSAPSPLAPRAHQPQPHVPCIYPQPFHQAPGHLPLTGPDKTPNPSVPQFPHPSPRPPPPAYKPPALLPPTPAPDPKPRSSGRPDSQQGFPAAAALAAAGPLVTGEQRFLEGLRETFDLKLPADPGDQGLRMIIIDGSNVAMSHGLGHFFSCRGIALAVQHFWTRGHRRISTFLPQWRQKKDPKIKEQHYLTTLQDLGLLSYTPSREVQGKRINSYDDRFMLQLAQQSDGVIVTNDNLRDLLDESQAWKDIIKKRLLQYTFVGDLFMVPDDPLGRGGPHLDHFLRSEHGTPDPGSHSFAGIASTYPSTKVPRAKTEVLQYRDLTPGGAPEPGQRGSWAAWPMNTEPGRAASPGGPKAAPERGDDETARLRESLCQVFPGQDSTVGLVLWRHPTERDINLLSHMVLEQQRG